jgi:large subunit ribosomal protein L4
MSTVNVQSPDGDLKRTVELPDALFDVQVNIPLVHQVVVAQLAAARQGTASSKTRGEVRGGGRKPYRQKGTGRARQGSTRAPQFAGGGTVHGPTPRSYTQRTPKKMKAAALRSALSDRARAGLVHVVSALVDGETPSTKTASAALARIASSRHVLVVLERHDQLSWKSLRNVETVHVIAPDQLNTYDVLVADDVVFTEGALAAFIEGPSSADRGAAIGDAVETLAAERPIKKAAAKKSASTETATEKPAAKKTAAKKSAAKKTAAKKTAATSDAAEAPATDAGSTAPAGEGVSDDEAVAEVAEQTSADLKAADVFERESDAASTETPVAEADADEVAADAPKADEPSGDDA